MKRTICILLSLMLALTWLAALCVTAHAAYNVGDIIEYGNYPQSKVTAAATIAALNAAAGPTDTWTSYGYYSGSGGFLSDGSMTAKDFMRYKDMTYGGAKYRGVYFSAYRPTFTGDSLDSLISRQDNNGYDAGQIYWFKFEPVKWRVLDPGNGLVMTESLLDAQAFSNYEKKSGTEFYNETGKYASEWSTSSLRKWLNSDFFNTAFVDTQKANIKTTYLTTKSTDQSQYDSAQTFDKIYLLSYEDALKPAYGFSASDEAKDSARKASGSDYAQCQGLYARFDEDGFPAYWRLRSPAESNNNKNVNTDGTVLYSVSASYTSFGIRPVCRLSVIRNDTAINLQTTYYKLKWIADNVTTTANVPFGNPISVYKPADPVKPGFKFKGWLCSDGTTTVSATMPAKDLTFTAQFEPFVVTALTVKKLPDKTVYTYRKDKAIDLSGMELEATYSDGTTQTVTDLSAVNASGYSAKPRGEKAITVEYAGVQAEPFTVTVKYVWWQWLIVILLFGWIWY